MTEATTSAGMIAAVIGGVFGFVYITSSCLLLKCPTLLHKRKSPKFRCRHVSHRGGAGENLENTLTAFEHAAQVGTDMLELDVQLTKDGQVVVAHDDNLLRLTGRNCFISQTNYQDMPLLKERLHLHFDPNVLVQGKADRHIPLLREVFQKFPTHPINIDTKFGSDEIIEKVSSLVKEFSRTELTVWANVDARIVRRMYAVNSEINLCFSMRACLKLLLFFYIGLLPFLPLREGFYEVFLPTIFLRKDRDAFSSSKKFKLLLWIADKMMMRPALFRHLNARGIQTVLWVLNEEQDWKRAAALGASGMMTDYPSKLRHYLDSQPNQNYHRQ